MIKGKNIKYQGIYKIRNLLNGKVYIGQSANITDRFRCHKKDNIKKLNYPLYKAFKKYNLINFEFIVLEYINDINKLNEREQYWMDFYNSYNPEFGYNLCKEASSTRGYKISEEARKRFSEKQKKLCQNPDYRKNISEKVKELWKNEDYKKRMRDAHKGKPSGRKGKKHSEKTREKMSKAHTGKKLSEEQKLKLLKANTGRKCTEETKRKIGLANLGRVPSPEVREKISLSLKGNIPWNKGLKILNNKKEQ